MAYLSFARKYRPKNFDEIAGQEHVATTLRNAIAMDKVSHAYLFAGPRGVGKTSTARILAKSLNCEKGPTAVPCDKCVSCREISEGINMDVIEIDGASNRGIDEIRNLRENVKFASLGGKFRIYIIDEVHMLTTEAFNALLKTLEEPPAHAKFIFATTRPYKVPPTIISRCQRFDFRKLATQEISKKLEEIKEKEKLTLADEAIFMIAHASDGSMRDAEVILDQILAFTKGKVEREDVVKVLGLLEEDVLFEIGGALLKGEKENLMILVNNLINGGRDPLFITTNLIEHFRNLMAAKITKDESASMLALRDEDYQRLRRESEGFSLDELLYIIYTLSAAADMIKKTSLGQIPLEISLIKLTDRKRLVSLKEILDRLDVLEKRLKDGVREEFNAEPVDEIPVAAPTAVEIKSELKEEEIAAEKDILLLHRIKNSWPKILNLIKQKKMSLGTFLSEGAVLKVKENALFVGFAKNNSFHKEQLEANSNKKFVEEAVKNIIGEDVILRFEIMEASSAPAAAEGASIEEAATEEGLAGGENSNGIDPIVESALNIFDGKIIDVREGKKGSDK